MKSFPYTIISVALFITASVFPSGSSLTKDIPESLCSQLLDTAHHRSPTALMERHVDDPCIVFAFDGGGSRGFCQHI